MLSKSKTMKYLTAVVGLSASVSAYAQANLVASCFQEPAGCHVETGQSESSYVCVPGVDLKIFKGNNSKYTAIIRVLNAISSREEFNETIADLNSISNVNSGRYGEAKLTATDVYSHSSNPNLQRREISHQITINVTPNAPNQMYGYYHAAVGCDYGQVTPGNCYSTQGSIRDLGGNEYGYVTTGRFECQVVDKGALQIQY